MSSNRKKVLIIAPHVDDEMIGCWSVLNEKGIDVEVLYLHELTDPRVREACVAAECYDYEPFFDDDDGTSVEVIKGFLTRGDHYARVYVPSRRDSHADHQAVNREYLKWATHFYSVDMARGLKLGDATAKLNALNQCYPSQVKLWTRDDKYWLFEDIRTTDFDTYSKIKIGETMVVTVLDEYAYWVRSVWALQWGFTLAENILDARNALFAHCKGRITIETPHYIMEA